MRKRALCVLLAALVLLNGCADAGKASGSYQTALVIDVGTVDDKSFNQGAWEGIKRHADESGIPAKYFKAPEMTTDAFAETIELAVWGGAKVVVCPGFLFEEPIYRVQERYPEVHFILMDGVPQNGGEPAVYAATPNTLPMLYREEEAGFLAGYAAVKEGYRKLGFLGGMALPSVIRFGHGYLAGADYAAAELNLPDVEVLYSYTGTFEATPETQTMAAAWYQSGTDVIFACGGSVGNSVMAAAEAFDKKVIGVDVDQSFESETVLTSAVKMLSDSVYEAVKSAYEDSFAGGSTHLLSAENGGIGLTMETSRFAHFSQEDYDRIYKKLASGEVVVSREAEKSISQLHLTHLLVREVK